jgi:hypothetical protein
MVHTQLENPTFTLDLDRSRYFIRPCNIFFVLSFIIWSVGSPVLADAPYQGILFDAHAHLSNRSQPGSAYEDLKAAGFEKAILFADISRADAITEVGNGLFLVFADPFKRKKVKIASRTKEVRYQFSSKRLAKIEDQLKTGTVGGFGEIYFRLGWAPFAPDGISTDIHSDGARKLLAVAKSYNATVHIHLDSEHADALKELLATNPEIRFVLAHCGFFKPSELSALLDKYPNLYAEISLVFNPYVERFANLPSNNGKLRPDWKALLVHHADRLMIGTDYTGRRAEQLPKLATYYRRVLGLLPTAVADKIAHGNFRRLFIER